MPEYNTPAPSFSSPWSFEDSEATLSPQPTFSPQPIEQSFSSDTLGDEDTPDVESESPMFQLGPKNAVQERLLREQLQALDAEEEASVQEPFVSIESRGYDTSAGASVHQPAEIESAGTSNTAAAAEMRYVATDTTATIPDSASPRICENCEVMDAAEAALDAFGAVVKAIGRSGGAALSYTMSVALDTVVEVFEILGLEEANGVPLACLLTGITCVVFSFFKSRSAAGTGCMQLGGAPQLAAAASGSAPGGAPQLAGVANQGLPSLGGGLAAPSPGATPLCPAPGTPLGLQPAPGTPLRRAPPSPGAGMQLGMQPAPGTPLRSVPTPQRIQATMAQSPGRAVGSCGWPSPPMAQQPTAAQTPITTVASSDVYQIVGQQHSSPPMPQQIMQAPTPQCGAWYIARNIGAEEKVVRVMSTVLVSGNMQTVKVAPYEAVMTRASRGITFRKDRGEFEVATSCLDSGRGPFQLVRNQAPPDIEQRFQASCQFAAELEAVPEVSATPQMRRPIRSKNVQTEPRFRYSKALTKLRDMGFDDSSEIRDVLTRHEGLIGSAMRELCPQESWL